LEFVSSEELEDLVPVGRAFEVAEIGLHVSRKNSQRCRFSDSVCAYKSEDLSRPGDREPMELETVCSVSMSDLAFESLGQVDDLDGFERTPFDAHAASNAHVLGDKADLACFGDFNAHLSGLVDGAGLEALLGALLRLALVGVDDRDSKFLGIHIRGILQPNAGQPFSCVFTYLDK